MKHKWHGAALAMAAAGSLLLSACGSNPTTSSSAGNTASAECGGKTNLTGEGSTAQKDAIDAFVAAYVSKCPGQNVAYNASGSGTGVKNFNAGQVDFGGSDSPLSAANGEVAAAKTRCKENDAWNLPLVFGPVAIGFMLDVVK